VVKETNAPLESDDKPILNDDIFLEKRPEILFHAGADLVRDLVDDLLEQDLRAIICFKELGEKIEKNASRLLFYILAFEIDTHIEPQTQAVQTLWTQCNPIILAIIGTLHLLKCKPSEESKDFGGARTVRRQEDLMTCYCLDYFNPDLVYPIYLSVRPLLLHYRGFWHLRENFWRALCPREWILYQVGMQEVVDTNTTKGISWLFSANEMLIQERLPCLHLQANLKRGPANDN